MKKGFTLLELLLVISLLAILGATVGPNFVSSSEVTLNSARKERFRSNYQSIQLAANMFILGSETTQLIRTGGDGTDSVPFYTYSEGSGGLKALVASNALQIETCMYQNLAGEDRYFALAVGPTTGGSASCSTRIASDSAGTSILYDSYSSLEAALQTKKLDTVWEEVKDL